MNKNIFRCETQYSLLNTKYPSEIYMTETNQIQLILEARSLPNELQVKGPECVIVDGKIKLGWEDMLNKECISYYIRHEKYVDALHRLFYMMTVKGRSFDFVNMINDKGLAHKLTHVKSKCGDEKQDVMVCQADDFEESVIGSYLWALSA